jgi:tetraacyldisaccharide 4'-kinase
MRFKTPKYWQNNNILSYLLLPFSWIYYILHNINYTLQTPKKFDKKVICIGNIIAGGAGKTPVALAVCKLLQKQGLKVAFASKNYTGKNKGPKLINLDQDSAHQVSDEPLMLAKTALSFVSPNRVAAIKLACSSEADIIIVDDGLQNNSFFANIKILVVDSIIQFGNKKLLPAGPLRESIDNLERFDLIFQIGGNKSSVQELAPYQNKLFILNQTYQLPKKLANKYIAFTGMAYPQKFFTALQSLDFNIAKTINFPDHFLYQERDLINLYNIAKKYNAQLITTEKDYVRISSNWQKKISFLRMELNFETPNEEKLAAKRIATLLAR